MGASGPEQRPREHVLAMSINEKLLVPSPTTRRPSPQKGSIIRAVSRSVSFLFIAAIGHRSILARTQGKYGSPSEASFAPSPQIPRARRHAIVSAAWSVFAITVLLVKCAFPLLKAPPIRSPHTSHEGQRAQLQREKRQINLSHRPLRGPREAHASREVSFRQGKGGCPGRTSVRSSGPVLLRVRAVGPGGLGAPASHDFAPAKGQPLESQGGRSCVGIGPLCRFVDRDLSRGPVPEEPLASPPSA